MAKDKTTTAFTETLSYSKSTKNKHVYEGEKLGSLYVPKSIISGTPKQGDTVEISISKKE